MSNPYRGDHFFSFFATLFGRLVDLMTGRLSLDALATDEIQVFTLALVAVSSALIGTLLVFKRLTMLANSLSHTILLGIVITYLLFAPSGSFFGGIDLKTMLVAALITGGITTWLTQLLTHVFHLQEDASIGLVFTTLFAFGIISVTIFTRNTHIGTEVIMGNVDALHWRDLKQIFWVALVDFFAVLLFYKELKLLTFDPGFAKTQGISTHFLYYLLMFLTAATVIGAFRAVGVLLVLSFFIAPTLTARLFFSTLKGVIGGAVGFGVVGALCGVALSRHSLSVYQIPLSTAGITATFLGTVYLVALTGKTLVRKIDRRRG